MKRFALAALASAGLMMIAAGAGAQTWNGPEFGVQGGYGWGTSKGDVLGGGGSIPYEFSPDGFAAGAHGGYNWQFGRMVLGFEGDVEGADISRTHTTDAFGDRGRSLLDMDASVRGKLGWAFDRFLVYGTGGVAFGDVDSRYIAPDGLTVGSDSGVRVGWTGGAGIAYAVTPNWQADLEYRYTDLGRSNIHFVDALNGTSFSDSNEFNYNMVRVGLTYRFAPPPPPPPMETMPMPAAAPAAAPPPPPRTFLVFFDFDRDNLTEDAQRVIRSAAATYRATGAARIDVSGYTDLAGTQAYNLRLSRRRADAVAAYLAGLGVPRRVMDVRWFGKERPRVPTANGVREPQNRRVEIVMP